MELRKTSRALEEEKKKTDKLLYQMLPANVADELKNGRPVPAGNDHFLVVHDLNQFALSMKEIMLLPGSLNIVNMDATYLV